MAPVPCGLSWRERLGSVRLDEGSMETAERKNYYDTAAVNALVGSDSVERLYEDTDGIGYTRQADNGDWYYRNRKTREIEKMGEQEMDTLLGAKSEVTV